MGKLAYRSYQLYQLAKVADKTTLLRVYKAYLLPIIDYGDVLYANSNADRLKKLQSIQNRCLKTCLRLNLRTSTLEIHKKSNLTTLDLRRENHLLNIAYKRSRNSYYTIQSQEQRTRLRQAPVLKTSIPNCRAYINSIEYQTASLWNVIPLPLKNLSNIIEFKKSSKNLITEKFNQLLG